MQNTKRMAKKIVSLFAVAMLLLSALSMNVFAEGYEDLEEGNYTIDAGISCYVFPAMGGVEFGAPLLDSAVVTVAADGTAEMTLNLKKATFSVMNIPCTAFIDAANELAYYDGSAWQTPTYTLSADTGTDSGSNEINYVDSITFPLSSVSDTYALALYVNSNIMGTQFGGTTGAYAATLTVDWNSCEKIAVADETATQDANVEYEVNSGYTVKIPATITVNTATKVGDYEVEAVDFIIPNDAYVTVAADTTGTVTNGTETLSFSNTLEDAQLITTGDKLDGSVTITQNAVAPGSYAGTLNFTINYFAD